MPFELSKDEDRARLEALVASGAVRFCHDTLEEQLRELVASLEPTRKLTPTELHARIHAHLGGRALAAYGTWFFYPWSGRLVHVLPRDELRHVRTDRNRYKITSDEQRRLAGSRVGIVGLSVGTAAALTFALEGVGGAFKLADFDHLSLSNLNRLRGGLHELGVDKTSLAAREMLELDPYLDITLFSAGLHEENLDAFLLEGGKLDLLVEECDDLYIKIAVRERARALGIAVVMDTSDRGLLDVERFDLEPNRPILHGLIGDVAARSVKGLPTKEKVPLVLAIIDGKRMSTRMAASLPEVDESISTWPQLASGVALGGAITCDVARRILLGQMQTSGRFYVDIESVARDGAGDLRVPLPPRPPRTIAPEAQRIADLPPEPSESGVVSHAAVRWIVAHGTLAPSAHNAQPWHFVFRTGTECLECRHDARHDLPSLDFEHGATWVAFGAALENMDLAARGLGLRLEIAPFPDPSDKELVCRISFTAAAVERQALLPYVRERVTNRKRGARAALEDADSNALLGAAAHHGATLHLAVEPSALDELGRLIGACDRLSSMNRAIFHEVMPGYRWTREDVERHRDGLDVATMELTEPDRAGFQLLSDWPIMETLARIGGGRAIESTATKAIAGSSAVGLVTMPDTCGESYLTGGRAIERVWLTATARGLALQPWTGLPYLFARLERGRAVGFSDADASALRDLRARYLRVFDVPQGHAEVLLFRLAHADPPTARSLRRRLDDVLRFE